MPTVPNWIGHSVVIFNRFGANDAIPVKSWRATRTQIVLTLDNETQSEMRFHLDNMHAVGWGSRAELLDANAPDTIKRLARIRANQAVRNLETEVALARFDRVRDDDEATLALISVLHDKASAAMAAIAEVL